MQLLSASRNQCCYFTLQNEILAVLTFKRQTDQVTRRQLWRLNVPDLNSVDYSV